MTDKEIIEWWEQITELCNECHPDSFKNVLSKEVANATFGLLKRLKRISNGYRYQAQAQKGELRRLNARNNELNALNKTASIDAIKSFAERLTDTILDKSDRSLDNPNGNDYFISDVIEDIDNLVKEMVGENDG